MALDLVVLVLVVTFPMQICSGYIRKIFECKKAQLIVIWTELCICMSCLILLGGLYQGIVVCSTDRTHKIHGHNNQNFIYLDTCAEHHVWASLFTFYLKDQSPNEIIILKFMLEK